MAENIQLIKDIATIVSFCCSGLLFILSLIIAKKKSKQAKGEKASTEKAEQAASTLLFIKNLAEAFVIKAEDFINYSGADKKAWVVTQIKEGCIAHGINYDEDTISNAIEAAINLSKRVNANALKLEEVAKEDKTNA